MTTEKMNRKKSSGLLLVLLLLVGSFALFGLFYLTWSYTAEVHENERLISELNQTRMIVAIRSTLWDQKRKTAERREKEVREGQADRELLKTKFLRQNAEKLLTVVNPWNQISAAYQPDLVELGDGLLFDESAAGALAEMLSACRKAGGVPCPISAYRTQEYQQELFDNKIRRVIAAGYSAEEAPLKAAESVAVPGTSEHQLGLAVDIVDEYYPELDYAQEWTGTQQWLIQHCTEYGFILRYPSDDSSITGIIFEPWHYRYVGKSIALKIKEMGVTLEEYVNQSGS